MLVVFSSREAHEYLHEVIGSLTVSDIKGMHAYLPEACKVERKEVLVTSILEQLSSPASQLNGSKLGLTAAGLKALHEAPADVLRGIWRKWLKSTLLDEFSRLTTSRDKRQRGA